MLLLELSIISKRFCFEKKCKLSKVWDLEKHNRKVPWCLGKPFDIYKLLGHNISILKFVTIKIKLKANGVLVSTDSNQELTY